MISRTHFFQRRLLPGLLALLLAGCGTLNVSVQTPTPIPTDASTDMEATIQAQVQATLTAQGGAALAEAATPTAPPTGTAQPSLTLVATEAATLGPTATRAATRTASPSAVPTGTAAPTTTPTAVPPTVNIELVFDASGSMAGAAGGGETKIEAARRAMGTVIDALPTDQPTLNVGFRVFGHRGDNTEAGRAESCASTELLVPVAGVDAAALQAQSTAWEPTGWTPISLALQRAGEDLRAGANVQNRIVLVTDGEETCAGDPCAVAAALAQSQAQVQIHVVGFGVEPNVAQGLRCIAEESGGAYYDAPDGNALADILLGVTLSESRLVVPELVVPPFPTPVFDFPPIPTPDLPDVTIPTPDLPDGGIPTPDLDTFPRFPRPGTPAATRTPRP